MSASFRSGIVGAWVLMALACSEGAPEPASGGTGGSPSGRGGGVPAVGGAGIEAGGDTSDGTTNAGGSVSTPVTWKVIAGSTDPLLYASTPAAASRGSEAAVAYVEQADTTPPTARVVLQRFDATAERIGPLLELGNDPDQQSNVTLSSDGKQYAACWDSLGEVHCSLVDDQGQARRNVLALEGSHAAIVAARNGWVIAYATSDSSLRVQSFAPELELTGTPLDLERSTHFGYSNAAPLLTATPTGFALVGARSDDGHEALLRLGVDLKPDGVPIALGRDFWFYGQLLASDTRAAVSLSTAYGSYLLLSDTEQVTAELLVAGGGKTGMDEAFLLTDGGIGAAWLTRDGDVRRRFFADGRDADIGLETRQAGELLGLPEEGTDSYQQLLTVGDRTLLVGRDRRYGYFGPDAIRAAALSFP